MIHGGSENLWIHINLPGNVLNTITFPDPPFVYLRYIIVAPFGVVSFVIDYRDANGAQLSSCFVKDQVTRNAREVLNIGVIEFQRPRSGVLRSEGILVHEALPEFVHGNPNHFAIFVARASPHVANGEWQLGKFKSVTAVEMPHMPEPSAGFLRHLDAVACVAEIDGINWLCFEVLQLHGVVVLISTAGEDHAFLCFDANFFSRSFRDEPKNLAVARDQFLRGGREHHFHLANIDVVIDNFEKPSTAAKALGPRKF